MTVKELKELLQPLPDDLPVKMLSLNTDNVNENYNIEEIVLISPVIGDAGYKNELVIIPV